MFVFIPRLIEFLSKTAKGDSRQSKKNEAVTRKRKSLARCSVSKEFIIRKYGGTGRF